ncbi:MAG: aspartate aminotransferase family protein [Chloroflexi bacterium]|nr:aspartate aminotransferase family protein [Chloroflexota bacterium]
MTSVQTIQQAEDSLLVPLYNKRDIALVRGAGVYVWDSDGTQYLDLTSNYGVNILGHCHPTLTEAIVRQAQTLTNCHASFYSEPRARYLEALRRVFPPALSRFFFCNSGAEAVEATLKFARALRPDRRAVVATKKAYHGRTMGALAATHDKKYREPFEPLLPGFSHVTYGSVDELAAAVGPETMAVILEPVQGEGGINPAPAGYLAAARAICDQAGALLIFDEVQTAFRTGHWLACQGAGVMPDLVAVSKAIAGGLPMGLVAMTEDAAAGVPAGTHGNTFGGNPLVCAAALAVIETIERDGLLAQSADVGSYFVEQLRTAMAGRVRDVRGAGLMIGVELKERSTKYLRGLQEAGVLALPAGPVTLRFLPPLILQRSHVDQAVATFARLLPGS